MERTSDAGRSASSPSRCPFCHDGLEDTTKVVACAACSARHHQSCWDQHGACSTCASREVLVPRRGPRAHSAEPPRGSRIEVTREGARAVYTFPGVGAGDVVLGFFFLATVLLSPLGLWFLYHWLAGTRRRLVLDGDALEVTLAGKRRPHTFRRSEIDGVRVLHSSQLALDCGVELRVIATGTATPSLSPPEVDWLAEELRLWLQG